MSDQMQEHLDSGEAEDKPEALRMCLNYLYREAVDADLRLTAQLIRAAAESIQCRCGQHDLAINLSGFHGGTRQ